MRDEGYLLIATGAERFVDRAAVAAMSIRARDGKRPICLLCSPDLLDFAFSRYSRTFGIIKPVRPPTRPLLGTEYHLFMDQWTPFKKTLYMDSDCLACSDRIHDLWDFLDGTDVGICGSKRTSGKWRVDVDAVKRKYGISHVVQNNGGVVYFESGSQSTEFFATARKLFFGKHPLIQIKHISGGGIANEPIYAVAMALLGVEPVQAEMGMNVSTNGIVGCKLRDSSFRVKKRNGKKFDVIIAHFLGMDENPSTRSLHFKVQSYNDKRLLARSKS